MTRTVFKATLEVSNTRDNTQIKNVKVTLDVRDGNGNSANAVFGIKDPELTGIGDVNGGGEIRPEATVKAIWTLVPSRAAAQVEPKQYNVGGTLSYTQDGIVVTIPLFPAPILVKPDPILVLHYFWQRDVYSDDPFTPDVIEPAEPFSLGLLIANQGNGTARNLRIVSSQPEIIENKKGLRIGFNLIGSQLGTEALTPSFGLNFGDLLPHTTAVARWLMVSSLQGKFIEYKATFEHVDDIGTPRSSDVDFQQPNTSLIDSVNIHELEHVVRADIPTDDNQPDFLVNDIADNDRLPDTLYQSDATTAPVTAITSALVDQPVTEGSLEVHLTVPPTGGWVYIRANDPSQGQFRLLRVVRSDGRVLRMDDNAWTTHRTIRLQGQAPYAEHRLHLFDRDTTGSYTLVYGYFDPPNAPIGRLKTLRDGTKVVFGRSDSGGGSGGGGSGNNGGANGLSGPVAVTAVFPDGMYVEAVDRSAGIKVVPVSAAEGALVAVEGTLRTGANGERYIEASSVKTVGTQFIEPLGITTKALYSGDYFFTASNGAGQRGMVGGSGLNTVGLLAQTMGRVTAVGNGAFLVDDGYGRGIKVFLPGGAPLPSLASFVGVNGAVSTEVAADGLYPLLRPRRPGDVVYDPSALGQTFTSPFDLMNTGWNQFSLPGIPANPAPPAVLSHLDPGDGSGLQGRLSRYDAPTQSDIFWDIVGGNNPFGNFLLGEGYRLRFDPGETLTLDFAGFRAIENTDRWISLPRLGATQIGHPYSYPVRWDAVQVTDGTRTIPLSQVTTDLAPWLDTRAQYLDSATNALRYLGLPEDNPDSVQLTPWRGYFVFSQRNNLALIIPAQSVAGDLALYRLEPDTAAAGSQAFTLTVHGTGFVDGAVVQWNGTARSTTFISRTQLTAEIPAADIAAPGQASVTVVNPSPGGETSNALPFTITNAPPPPADTTPPVSRVLPLLSQTSDPNFTVSWSGEDEPGGSGLKNFDIWVKDNDGAYTKWQSAITMTSAVYAGAPGHTYRFYSIARDNAGNVEAAPTEPDAITTVLGSGPAPGDTTPPTSAVAALPAVSNEPTFTVTWSGQDEPGGSGLQSFDIWVKNNDAAYTKWQSAVTDTSASFTGLPGHTYRFYSIARDNAGNVEAAPNLPDAITTIAVPNPMPQIASLSPDSTLVGTPAFTLTVNGANFVSTSVVQWNGQPRATTWVSATRLTAAIPASDVAAAGTATITVVNPGPGGGASNALLFTISAHGGPPVLQVTDAVAQRDGANLVVDVTITNRGNGNATGVRLLGTTRLNGIAATGPLPDINTLAAKDSATVRLIFPGTAAAPGSRVTLNVDGTSDQGTFTGSRRVEVP